MKVTKKDYEEYLNDLIPFELNDWRFIINGKLRCGPYGTILRRHDSVAFEVDYQNWKRENQ